MKSGCMIYFHGVKTRLQTLWTALASNRGGFVGENKLSEKIKLKTYKTRQYSQLMLEISYLEHGF